MEPGVGVQALTVPPQRGAAGVTHSGVLTAGGVSGSAASAALDQQHGGPGVPSEEGLVNPL